MFPNTLDRFVIENHLIPMLPYRPNNQRDRGRELFPRLAADWQVIPPIYQNGVRRRNPLQLVPATEDHEPQLSGEDTTEEQVTRVLRKLITEWTSIRVMETVSL